MTESPLEYRRVDHKQVIAGDGADVALNQNGTQNARFRLVTIPLSMALCATQAIITVTASNFATQYPTSTLISVIGFGFLMLLAIIINPLLRVIFRGRVQPLGRVELMAIIASLMVTAGVSTFGLSDVLVPVIATPWNAEWNTPQRGWDTQLHPHLRRELYITDVAAIRLYREGVSGQPADNASWAEWLDFYRSVARIIPWKIWLKPLGFWMIFVAGCYGLFWSLSYLVLGLWSQREKLIFPLAKLSEVMLPSAESQSITPPVVRQPLFYLGLAFSLCLLLYNAAAVSNLIPLAKVPLGMGRGGFNALMNDTFFAGLHGGGSYLVIFTCIGIAFMLPLDISFSIWFYFWVGRLLILILVKMGHGQNFDDFPSDWTWAQNPIASLGMGGIMLFSCVTLYRAAFDFIYQVKQQAPSLHKWLPLSGLCGSFAVVTLWLAWNHLPIGWAVFITAFLLLITLGIMRIVAESGVFWIQSNASLFHLYKMLGLGKVLSPVLIAPLIPIYAILFFDIKTFIAPNVLNAAKMQGDIGGSRIKFHLNIALSLATSIVTAITYSLILAYGRGAQQMNNWFYSNGPQNYFDQANRATTMQFQFEPTTFGWFAAGGSWVVLSIALRQTLFWFPHPVGFLMNINPLMKYLWFSFFIGWVIKKLVVKYGGKVSFDLVSRVMLGLIFGEVLAIVIVGAINLLPFDMYIPGIDLNRYNP